MPILGICYGSQLMAYKLGGEVATAPVSEYGKTDVEVDTSSLLFEGVSATTTTWMSHTDYIAKAPQGFKITGHTGNCPVAAMENATSSDLLRNALLPYGTVPHITSFLHFP